MGQSPGLMVALDYPDAAQAQPLVERLDPSLCRLKVGHELFTRAGPAWIERLSAAGFDVFLDLKYHDIPNTVAAACRSAAALGVWMINVHALGGRRMLTAARTALDGCAQPPLLVAVTVLTSMEQADLAEFGVTETPDRFALRLAGVAHDAGCDGVVCSAREAAAMRAAFGPDWRLVTPGIRAATDAGDDQRRTLTAAEAVAAGATDLVVGRPVTAAPDPVAALASLQQTIDAKPGM